MTIYTGYNPFGGPDVYGMPVRAPKPGAPVITDVYYPKPGEIESRIGGKVVDKIVTVDVNGNGETVKTAIDTNGEVIATKPAPNVLPAVLLAGLAYFFLF